MVIVLSGLLHAAFLPTVDVSVNIPVVTLNFDTPAI